MATLVDTILGQLTPEVEQRLSKSIGIEAGKVRPALSAAVATQLSAVLSIGGQKGGAGQLSELLPTGVDDLTALIRTNDGLKNLNKLGAAANAALFADQQEEVVGCVATASNIPTAAAEKVMNYTAPMVLGTLNAEMKRQKSDPAGLVNLVDQQRKAIDQTMPASLRNCLERHLPLGAKVGNYAMPPDEAGPTKVGSYAAPPPEPAVATMVGSYAPPEPAGATKVGSYAAPVEPKPAPPVERQPAPAPVPPPPRKPNFWPWLIFAGLLLLAGLLLRACSRAQPAVVAPVALPTETATVVATFTPTMVPAVVVTDTPTVVPAVVVTDTPTVVPAAVVTDTPTVTPVAVITATPVVTDGTTLPAVLTGATWQWQRTIASDGTEQAPDDPAQYTLALQDDGLVAIQADCNSGSGQLTTDDAGLSFAPFAVTTAACLDDSLSSDFVDQLQLATGYTLEDGNLILTLDDGRRMEFSPAP